ncbi:MAG: hypothetical protein CVV04_04890 [Firmicutes bacterium HGW-Firmicutes-9]|jgi:hypothetical protein|nr:MAG: hypothetical protein CVV04_04890 [Firmicutes bacterium HGW-Firmicutes-9]
MRRKLSFLVTLWWIILCGVIGVCMLLFANRTPIVSEQENRTLAGMPQLSLESMQKGEISEQFESFLTDQFFLRSDIVDGMNSLKHLFSALTVDDLLNEEGEEVFVPQIEDAQTETAEELTEITAQEITQETIDGETPLTSDETVTGDVARVWLEHKDGTKDALFTYTKEDIQKAADVINTYAGLLPVGGTVHVMLVPRAQTVNKFALHLDTESGWSSEMETALETLLSSNVQVYNPYELFQSAILDGEYIYFRTDHHWTARGAYLAADAMLKGDGYQTIPLSDYQQKTIDGYLGSIYLHGRNAKLKELADEIEVFYPLLPAESFRVSNAYKKNQLPVIDDTQTNYLVFLGGTSGPYRVLESGYHTGRNMLMVCDSFGNSIAPFLLPYYDDVYMVDFRDEYYTRADARAGVKDYVRRLSIDDIYIVLSETNGIGSIYLNKLMPGNIN